MFSWKTNEGLDCIKGVAIGPEYVYLDEYSSAERTSSIKTRGQSRLDPNGYK